MQRRFELHEPSLHEQGEKEEVESDAVCRCKSRFQDETSFDSFFFSLIYSLWRPRVSPRGLASPYSHLATARRRCAAQERHTHTAAAAAAYSMTHRYWRAITVAEAVEYSTRSLIQTLSWGAIQSESKDTHNTTQHSTSVLTVSYERFWMGMRGEGYCSSSPVNVFRPKGFIVPTYRSKVYTHTHTHYYKTTSIHAILFVFFFNIYFTFPDTFNVTYGAVRRSNSSWFLHVLPLGLSSFSSPCLPERLPPPLQTKSNSSRDKNALIIRIPRKKNLFFVTFKIE